MLDKFKKEIVYCTYCPKLCRFACPVTNAEARETVTPTAKMNFMQLLRKGAVEFDEEIADVFYRCAGCLACRAYCKHRIEVPEVIEHARELAVNRGVEPASLGRYLETFTESHNAYGAPLAKKLDGLGLEKYYNKKADTLYFIGCTTLFHDPELAQANAKMLEAAGIDFAVYADPEFLCCGAPGLFSGDFAGMKKNANAMAKAFRKYKRVVTGCPSCYAQFKIKYPRHGIEIDAKLAHTTEIASELIRNKKLRPTGQYNQTIMYHDPCHLAKHFGIYEEPREILRALFPAENITEFSWNRDKNYCCGGGGLLPITAIKTSKSITHHRLIEFRENSPDMLVSSCPTCERTFRRSAPDIQIKDVMVLLADKL